MLIRWRLTGGMAKVVFMPGRCWQANYGASLVTSLQRLRSWKAR
jgi:hypothetical protein